MTQRILHLVRHGQIDLTTKPPTHQGWPLTARGQEQARLTAQRLARLPITAIHCSTHPRAQETAQIIAAQLGDVPLQSSEALCECVPAVPQHFRDWHAATGIEPRDQHLHDVPPAVRPWLNIWTHHVSFESVAAGETQSRHAFDSYFLRPHDQVEHEIIVSHGNLLGAFLCRVLQLPADAWMQLDMYNCALSEVRIEQTGDMRLLSFNDTGHLPYELRTDNERVLCDWTQSGRSDQSEE
ncbi:MAG TPA: histidine phosphatase family protein [Herpetosiphonaceae bacterium]